MYLFTRRARIRGAAGLDWAQRIAERSAAITDRTIGLWSLVWSEGFGTVSWSTWVGGFAALETMGDTLAANEEYQQLAEEGQAHIDGVDDQLMSVLYGSPDPGSEPTYVSVVSAVCAGGNIERAMGHGVDIAETATGITGAPTMFLRGMTGPYAGVGWLTPYADAAAAQAAQEALAADPAWLKLVDSTEGAFAEEPAFTQQHFYRRII